MGIFFDFPLQGERERERGREIKSQDVFSMRMYVNVLTFNKRIGYFPKLPYHHILRCFLLRNMTYT